MSLPGSVRVYYNYSDVIARECESLLYSFLMFLPGSVTGTESLFNYLS